MASGKQTAYAVVSHAAWATRYEEKRSKTAQQQLSRPSEKAAVVHVKGRKTERKVVASGHGWSATKSGPKLAGEKSRAEQQLVFQAGRETHTRKYEERNTQVRVAASSSRERHASAQSSMRKVERSEVERITTRVRVEKREKISTNSSQKIQAKAVNFHQASKGAARHATVVKKRNQKPQTQPSVGISLHIQGSLKIA